jgi:enterochelin esterase family protein
MILNSERRIFIYKPPGFTAEGPAYPLIVVAATYVSTIPLPAVLDNLLAKGLIPPVVVVFEMPVGTQQSDASCDPKYADFLAKELVPAVRERLHATTDPKQIIVGGASMGGLSASCAAFRHPEVFGNVLSQSGSYWWSPENDQEDEWLTRQLANSPKLPIKFYLSIGLLESEQAFRGGLISMLHSNRHFRDVLQARGYTVHYREINAGHDYYNWHATIADGLIALLDKLPTQPVKR